MSLPTGRYKITNVEYRNHITLASSEPDTPLVGDDDDGTDTFRWNISELNDGSHSFFNVHTDTFAKCQSEADAKVTGGVPSQKFKCRKRDNGNWTISPIDRTDLFWGLNSIREGTPVTLQSDNHDTRCQWKIERVLN